MDQTILKTLRDTWLTDEEYQHQRGILEEYVRIMGALKDLEKRYSGDKTKLASLRALKRKIKKDL